MQPTTTTAGQLHKRIYFSGLKGIKTELESNTYHKIKDKKFSYINEKSDYLTAIIQERKGIKEWYLSQAIEIQKNCPKVLNQLRADAIRHILSTPVFEPSQIKYLGISETDLLFEDHFPTEIFNYLVTQLNQDAIFKSGCVQMAIGGTLPDYTELNKLADILQFLFRKVDELKKIKTATITLREKYDENGAEIEYEPEKPPEVIRIEATEKNEIGLIQRYDNRKKELKRIRAEIKEIRKLYRIEKYRVSAEKSIPKNLCFFLLYDPIPIQNCKTDDEAFRYRLRKLRKSNLLVMLELFCRIHNTHYKTEIETANVTTKKMSYKPTKPIPKADKIELIQMGKAEGLSNPQISAQLKIPLRTVERYSKL